MAVKTEWITLRPLGKTSQPNGSSDQMETTDRHNHQHLDFAGSGVILVMDYVFVKN